MKGILRQDFLCVSVPGFSGMHCASGACLLPHHPLFSAEGGFWSSVLLHHFLFIPSCTHALFLRSSSSSWWWSAGVFAAISLCPFVRPRYSLLFWPDVHQQSVCYGLTPGDHKGIALFSRAACAGMEQPLRVVKRLPPGVLMKFVQFSERFRSESLKIA